MKNKVGLIGLGYVGLTLSVFLSEKGVDVYGVDDNKFKVEEIKKGHSYFFESGFDEKLRANVNDKLNISSDLSFVSDCKYIFISIGTPFRKHINVSDPLIPLILELIQFAKQDCIFIIRSTVKLGSTKKYQKFVENNNRSHITKSTISLLGTTTVLGHPNCSAWTSEVHMNFVGISWTWGRS